MMERVEQVVLNGEDETQLMVKVNALFRQFAAALEPQLRQVDLFNPDQVVTAKLLTSMQDRWQDIENQALETILQQRLVPDFDPHNTLNLRTHTEIRAWLNDPNNAGFLQQVTHLNLSGLNLKALPPEISNLGALQNLNLSNNQLTSLPDSICSLTALQRLDLSNNHLTSLPDSIGSLAALQNLNLSNNHLTSLPNSFGSLVVLQHLYLSHNKLSSLPDSIGSLTAVERISLYNNRLTSLPDSIGTLTALQRLDLSNNRLSSLPDSIGSLTALLSVDLSDNKLSSLPDSIGSLAALQTLGLYNNKLSSLPDSIGRLTALQTLLLTYNQLSSLPDSIGKLAALRELYLHNNQLSSLPDSIGKLAALRAFNLHNNRLSYLPDSIAPLTALYLPNGNPWIFISDKELEKCPNTKTFLDRYKAFKNYPTESSLGDLFKLIASKASPFDIRNTFDELDPSLKNRILKLARAATAASSYPSGSASSSSGPSSSCSSSSGASSSSSSSSGPSPIDERIFADIPRLARAVRSATFEKFKNLSQAQKKRVYGEVYQLAGKPRTKDRKWGEHHVFDNMLRFIDALEHVTKK